jgi:hypothetical protein
MQLGFHHDQLFLSTKLLLSRRFGHVSLLEFDVVIFFVMFSQDSQLRALQVLEIKHCRLLP